MKTVLKVFGISLALAIGLFVLMFLFAILRGHYSGYDGAHKDLYTVAVNNVFCSRGYISNGEITYDPKIHIIETDDYGRTLFFYGEYYDGYLDNKPNYGIAFVIMQESKDGYAYYYRDVCYMPYFDVTNDWQTISAKLAPDFLDALKEANDWNRELNEERCAKAKFVEKKPKGKLDPEKSEFDSVLYPYIVENGYTGIDRSICSFTDYCETDAYGRELYYVSGITSDLEEDGQKLSRVFENYDFAVVLNADGTFPENCIVEIPTPADSAAAISKLKQDTNWKVSQ